MNCYVSGISSYVGTTGVRVHKIGSAAATSTDLFGSANKRAIFNVFANPKLFILAAGTNDYGLLVPVATYQANMMAAVAAAQATGASVLLTVPPQRTLATGAVALQSDYRAALYAVANATGCSLVNFYDRWGPAAQSFANGLTVPDGTVHPSDKGMQDYAAVLLAALARPVPSTPCSCPPTIRESLATASPTSSNRVSPAPPTRTR